MSWSWKKELIQIPSVGHLKYDWFKQNIKQDNCIEHTLEVLSWNSDDSYHTLSAINLCHYLAENYEEEFISTAGGSGLIFSGQMSAIATANIMSDVGLKISQLRILLRILQNKIGVKKIESKKMKKMFNSDMIIPKFGECNYYHEAEVNLTLFYFGFVILLLFIRKRHNY